MKTEAWGGCDEGDVKDLGGEAFSMSGNFTSILIMNDLPVSDHANVEGLVCHGVMRGDTRGQWMSFGDDEA